jgi:putative Ca2+/H+ antiporter (TMEM165/GDT1 family)
MAAKYVWSARATATTITLWETAFLVWLGAVAAMVTKGALAGWLGAGVQRRVADRVEPRMVRWIATAALIVLGVLAVLETLGILVD